MSVRDRIPADYPVQPISPNDPEAVTPATCGTCGLTWDDGKVTSMTPVPAGRCPFESFHAHEEPAGFELHVEVGNAAMQDPEDIANALVRVAEKLMTAHKSGAVMDDNGNTVGRWWLHYRRRYSERVTRERPVWGPDAPWQGTGDTPQQDGPGEDEARMPVLDDDEEAS